MANADSIAVNLDLYFVGVFATVLRRSQQSKYPRGARILLPNSTPPFVSRVDEHVMIPRHEAFIGIPTSYIADIEEYKPRFIRNFLLPDTSDVDCPQTPNPIEMAFYGFLDGAIPLELKPTTQFRVYDGDTSDPCTPTCDNATYLHWVADMGRYANSKCVVDPKFLDRPQRLTAYLDISYGVMSVGGLDFQHEYDFINSEDPDYHQALADSIKISTALEEGSIVSVTVGGKKLDLYNGTDLILVIGSAPLEEIANPRANRVHCGSPLYHHEVLYRFSRDDDGVSDDIPLPVCLHLDDDGGKVTGVNHCIPPGFMAEPPTSVSADSSSMVSQLAGSPGYSLHLGVSVYSPDLSNASGFPVPNLRSAAHDANTMRALAKLFGFNPAPDTSDGILTNEHATDTALLTALQESAAQLKSGGYFILTFSGHGMPAAFKPGWVLHSSALLFETLASRLISVFDPRVKILVVTDACHSALRIDQRQRESAKVLPIEIVEALAAKEYDGFTLAVERLSLDFDAEVPTIYFVSACGIKQNTPDGPNQNSDSPFTSFFDRVRRATSGEPFRDFMEHLRTCARPRVPALTPWLNKPDADFDKLGPFRLP